MLNYQRVPSETTACQWGLNELSGECWLVSAFSYHISGLFSCHGYHKVLSSLISGFGFLIKFFMSSLDFYGISMGFLWDFYGISVGFLSNFYGISIGYFIPPGKALRLPWSCTVWIWTTWVSWSKGGGADSGIREIHWCWWKLVNMVAL